MAGSRALSGFVAALALGATGCPLLVEDDFVVIAPSAAAGAATAGSGSAGSPGGSGGGEPAPPECVPCADGERCTVDADCSSGRCSGTGTCRACGLRLTSVQSVCPAGCTRCDAGVCTIECSSKDACKEATLACAPGLACRVVCSGDSACDSASVQCPAEFPCDVVCTGKQACKAMVTSCASGPCGLSCSSEDACEDGSLLCGDDRCEANCSGGTETPRVSCGESCHCTSCAS